MTPLMLVSMTDCTLMNAARILPAMQAAMQRFDINTTQRIAGFIAQCAHESMRFTKTEENLSYRPETLMRIWPMRFPTLESTRFYAFSPEHLGNYVYCDRMGNGPEYTGDGYRFRGRGYLQITGRQMYYDVGAKLGLALMMRPETVAADDSVAWASAACVWRDIKGCNAMMDRGDFHAVTLAINGGTNGDADRNAIYAKCVRALTDGVAA